MAAAQRGKGWRSRYGPSETVQRYRPAYETAYINNPHKGTTTFQRFEGETAYPGMNWNHMRELYPVEVRECGLTDRWKTAPVTIETCWTVPYWAKEGWDLDWMIEEGYKRGTCKTSRQSRILHASTRTTLLAAFTKSILLRRYMIRVAGSKSTK
ncbi:MAG: hypothetical protein ABIF71_02120 [Planctomycetota bacterium]